MNETCQQRVEWAKAIAAVYACHPDVGAIILGGSTARGLATENSDIDLGLFWKKIASQQDRGELIRQVGGNLTRRVANRLRFSDGNPRRQGCIEVIEFTPPSTTHRVSLDLEHETVAGTEQLLVQVLDEGNLSLEKQELISVIQDGIPLFGHNTVGRWRNKSNYYPDELAYKMVSENISGIGSRLLAQVGWARTQDWFCLHEGFLDIGRRLFLCLLGLNRVWAFTDNPNFKGLKSFVDRLELKPSDFVNRLDQVPQTDASCSIRGFASLSEDVLELIEAHMPTVETHRERPILKGVRQRTAHCT